MEVYDRIDSATRTGRLATRSPFCSYFFDRLVRWVDGWLDVAGGPGAPLRYRMHNGTSAPPSSGAADWQPYPAFEALLAGHA